MRIKLTLFLFFANVAVFGLIYYLDFANAQAPEENRSGILGEEIKTTTAFSIRGRFVEGQPEIERRFVYEDRRWFVETPFRWPANAEGIGRKVASLLFIDPEIRIPIAEIEAAGKTLGDYGLDPARLTLNFTVPDLDPIELRIGAPTEVGNRLYVLSADKSEILVTSLDLLNAFAVDLSLMRDRRLFDIPDFEIRELVTRITTTGDLTVRLKKDAEQWRFEAPIEVEADLELVRTTLQQLTRLEAFSFPDTMNPEDRISTIEEPRVRITLEGNDRRETLLIGDEAPNVLGERAYYAMREDRPVVITVPADPFDQLLQAQRDLRERDFLKVDPKALTGVVMARKSVGEPISLKKLENDNWQVIDSDGAGAPIALAADAEVVDRLMKNFQRIEALDFVSDVPTQDDLKQYGLADPTWTLDFEYGDGSVKQLLVGDELRLPDGRSALHVKLADERFVYAVARDVTRLWVLDPLFYRNRLVQNLANSVRIQRVLVERVGEEAEVLLDEAIDPATQTWGTYMEDWPVERQGPFWDLIGQFREFKVASFLEKSFSEEGYSSLTDTYPWSLKITLTLALPGDSADFTTRDQVYYFTERLSGSFQAGGSPGNDSIFQVYAPMMENIFKLFLERRTPPEFDVEAPLEDAEEPALEVPEEPAASTP